MRPRSFREAATPLKIIVEVFDDLVDHMKNPVHREVRGIAQAGSALLLGSRGRRFEPCSPDQLVDLRGINSDGRLGEWLKPAVLKTRSEEHTSELQSLMRISYAVFCLKKKKTITERFVTVKTK